MLQSSLTKRQAKGGKIIPDGCLVQEFHPFLPSLRWPGMVYHSQLVTDSIQQGSMPIAMNLFYPNKHGMSALRAMLLLLFIGLTGGCTSLPSLDERTHSAMLPVEESQATALGRAITPLANAHPGTSGIVPLANARESFSARMLLADTAERSLDIQYYIWRHDLTGILLLDSLRSAADRGVRVRLLLDDHNTLGLDPKLASLDKHPNIEIRLFNPFLLRSSRVLGFITDFSRANRRMHNKSFTADNQVTIIGGRNIGDEYFAATEGLLFADLDVLAIGPVVQEVSADFDRYWASRSAYPAAAILAPVQPEPLQELQQTATALLSSDKATDYVMALHRVGLVDALLHGELALEWAPTRMISDDPAKGLGKAKPEALLPHQLNEVIGEPSRDVELISPYFVPTAAGVKAFAELTARGVRVRILTNSLSATDVVPVHAGYAKRRKALLEAGVILYESRRLSPEQQRSKSAGPFGSSGSSLHAKTFSVDGERIFVGSYNFDPRSDHLNTELGFVINSPTLARQIDSTFNHEIPLSAYEVRLDEKGRLYWLEHRDGEWIRHNTEPNTTLLQRFGVRFMSLLPIEWLL